MDGLEISRIRLLLYLMFLVQVQSSEEVPVIHRHYYRDGLEGDSASLPCVGSLSEDTQWLQYPRNLIATRETSGRLRVTPKTPWSKATCNVSIDERLSLHIPKLVLPRDNETFLCDNGSHTTAVHLTVYHKPTKAIISNSYRTGNNSMITVTGGETNSVTCETDSDFPNFNFTWMLEGRLLSTDSENQSVVNLKPDKTDMGSRLQCKVQYHQVTYVRKQQKQFIEEQTAEVGLNVLYIDPSMKEVKSIDEGDDVRLKSSLYGNPQPTYSWWKIQNGKPVKHLETGRTYLMTSVNRSQAGKYECQVENDVGTATTTVELIVQYTPEVILKYNPGLSALECKAEGVPDSYHFWPWEHRLGDVVVRTRNGDWMEGNVNRLTVRDQFEDAGLYVCKVGNSHGVKSVSYEYKAKSKPIIGQYPVSTYSTCYQGNGLQSKIVIPFYSFPEYINISWTTATGERVIESSNHTWVKKDVEVNVSVHGVRAKVLGKSAVLVLETEATGDLKLTIVNTVGSSSITVAMCEKDKSLSSLELVVLVSCLSVILVISLMCGLCVRYKRREQRMARQHEDVDLALADLAALCNGSVPGSRLASRSHSLAGSLAGSRYGLGLRHQTDDGVSTASTLRIPLGSKAFPTTLEGLMEQINRSSYTSSIPSVSSVSDDNSLDGTELTVL